MFKELPQILRSTTRQAHQQLDHHPLLVPLLRADLTQAQYAQVLLAMLWMHAPLQSSLLAALQRHDMSYALSDRPTWLRQDLAQFAIDGDVALVKLGNWPAPDLDSPAAVIGALYVLEGSSLGGRFIARQLAASLGLNAENGGRFFQGHGAATETHWGDFLLFAMAHCPAAAGVEACRAATDLFARFELGLSAVQERMEMAKEDAEQ
jgi:heme oxygenase (biliverdin-IX-beta and delta-forming)